ncbi:MAG: hypothetical protein ABH842_00945 [Candidatus Micrarchaeota archaeon]
MALNQVGSVGAVWPARYDGHNSRIKGFCTERILARRDLDRMVGSVHDIQAAHPQATRTTVRAFVGKGLLEGIRKADGLDVEAVVPADRIMPGFSMVYFGRNRSERMPDPEVLKAEIDSLARMAGIEPVTTTEAARRISDAGYAISPVDQNGAKQRDIARLLALYREAYEKYTFDITEGSMEEMLSNGNIVVVARERTTQDIVASLIAEHCTLIIDGQTVHLFELSDFATFRAHRGNGLMTLMQMDARVAIRRLHGDDAVIYSENRAPWEAVNRSSQKAGFTYCGTLPKHCILVSDRDFNETGDMENLHVWADVR